MCTGVEAMLISGLMTGAGTAASISAGRSQRKASERAASNELMRKEKTNEQARQLFNAEMENSDAGDAQATVDAAAAEQLAQAQALTDREDTGFTAATQAPGIAQSSSPVVKETAARQLADELTKAEGQMKARAALQGYSQRQRQRGTQFGRAAERMAMLGNFNQGWGQVGQIDQNMARFAGQNQAMLGDVLTGLGSIGMQYGANMAPAAKYGDYALGTAKLGAPPVVPSTYGLEGMGKLGTPMPASTYGFAGMGGFSR